jgi:hypothetical protein
MSRDCPIYAHGCTRGCRGFTCRAREDQEEACVARHEPEPRHTRLIGDLRAILHTPGITQADYTTICNAIRVLGGTP